MKKVIIFGAGNFGREAMSLIGGENVYAFTDNDPEKAGKYYCNKPVLTPDTISDYVNEYQLLIASSYYKEIQRQLDQMGIHNVPFYIRGRFMNIMQFKAALFDMRFREDWKIALAGEPFYMDLVQKYMEELKISENLSSLIEVSDAVSAKNSLRSSLGGIDLLITTQDYEISDSEAGTRILNLSRFNYDDYPVREELRAWKDKYRGKRCFIIGNGPSLRISDLDTLKENGMFCFACNKIYKAFDMTEWRPDIFVYSDLLCLKENFEAVINADMKVKLLNDFTRFNSDKFRDMRISPEKCNIKYFTQINNWGEKEYPPFSEDPSRVVFEGYTVTYTMIQFAAYMGFTEIYVLGLDHHYHDENYKDLKMKDYSKKDHFLDNYLVEGERVNKPRIDLTTKAYEKAEKYSRDHGFRIYNATRGGCLEVFERVDFDSLFSPTTIAE